MYIPTFGSVVAMFQVSPPEDMAQAEKAWHDGMMQEYAQGLIHVGNPPQMRQKIEELPLLVPSPGNYDLKSQLFWMLF